MGATPLFYAIMQNSVALVSALVAKGAKVTTTITFEEEVRSSSLKSFPYIHNYNIYYLISMVLVNLNL